MISKLITHGPSREAARLLMVHALDRYTIRGLRHNLNFLRTLLAHQRFARGEVTTGFIPEEFPDGYDGHVMSASERQDLLACAAIVQLASELRSHGTVDASTPLSLRLASEDEVDESLVHVCFERPTIATSSSILPSGTRVHVQASEQGEGMDGGKVGWVRSMELLSSGMGPSALLEARMLDHRKGAPLAVQVVEQRSLGWSLSAFGTTYAVFAALSPPHS